MVYQSMVSMSDILVLVVVTIGEVPDNEFTMPAMNKMIEKLLPNILLKGDCSEDGKAEHQAENQC